MRVHACMNAWMRTTIELDDEVRLALQREAAERGDRGYSDLINEILKRHLGIENEQERERRIAAALDLEGAWGEQEAEAVRARIRESRARWR